MELCISTHWCLKKKSKLQSDAHLKRHLCEHTHGTMRRCLYEFKKSPGKIHIKLIKGIMLTLHCLG